MLASLTSLLLMFPATQGGTIGSFEVIVENVSGDILCSVRARKASVNDLVAEIAAKTGRDLSGFDLAASGFTATIRLDSRPVGQALHYILGSVGYRAEITSRSIFVRSELPPFPEADQLLDAADLAYQRALSYHPTSSNGDQAELALARIQDKLGNASLSRSHYEVLADNYPASDHIEIALYEVANLLKRERNWEAAAVKYRTLIELESEDVSFREVVNSHPYAIEARLSLARCSAQLGNYEHAIYGLNDLDNLSPAENDNERGRRNYVRARALIGKTDYVDALRLLSRADTRATAGDHPGERVELIAEALALSGRPSDASLAWLEYSQHATGPAQAEALAKAAELALSAGDNIGALMICRQAKDQGHEEAIASLENQARAELDFVERDLVHVGFDQRLERGEEFVSQGQMHAAYVELNRLEDQTKTLSSSVLARFSIAYAQSLEAEVGVEETVRFLRTVLPIQPDIEERRAIYRLAAQLFEKNELFDRAIDALGGKL